MGSFRRRLPPTPLDLANGRLSGSQDAILILPLSEDVGNGSVTLPPSRRTSSPRILPTPPSPLQQFSPNSRGIQNSSNMNLSYNDENVGYQQPPPASPFERRRSVRRQLPPEPPNIQQYDSTPKLIIVNNNSSHQITKRQLSGETKSNKIEGIATLTIEENVENGNGLQRSCSTRSTRRTKGMEGEKNMRGTRGSNASSNLPPTPWTQHSLEQQHNNFENNSNNVITLANNISPSPLPPYINEEEQNTQKQQPPLLKIPSINALTCNNNNVTRHGRTLSSRNIKEEKTTEILQHQRRSLTEQTETMPLSPTTRPVASSLGATMSGPRIAFSKPKLTLNNKKEEEDILSNDIELDNEENQMIAKLSIASGRPSITSTNSISPSLSATTNNSALTPPPPSQAFFASAPSSPRDFYSSSSNCSSSRKYSASSGSACSSADSSQPQQNMSAALTDLAAISALNSRCHRSGPGTGSMAHLLEQQHILRREFTSATIPSQQQHSVENGGSSTILHGSQSNSSSSLSPSMEQLNCNTTVATSRSGSDVEISAADPSVLGFDPSLYVNGVTNQNLNSSPVHVLKSNGTIPSTSGNEQQLQQPRPRGLGLLHCTLQHFPVRKRLRVNVLKIEGLAGDLRPDLEIQPFCKLTLTSTKKQQSQQQQSVVKRGRDSVFNQEFFFDNFATEEIELKQLQIEVCHSSNQKLQRDLDIGEVRIPLRDLAPQLQTKKEVRIVEELKFFIAAKKLGKLHITTCIEKADRRLTINLIKVEDLPKWGIIGAPDVQIRIRMQQANGPEVVKCSRIIKNTTSAVYKEAVMFLVSTREADLARTKITISVHDLSRSVTGNDTIGFVFLGELASDKSEVDQWKSTMDHWGKEYKAVHTLKCPSSRCQPTLHVLDVQDENDVKENDD
ncbi:unnamed protein product [Meloidogyne enterolobii]|uniref:Uncharacterized protein n=1 Tax=Meloidogyne enterolobii TaxID=390850 RepID=A0ACB0Z5X1_MELEN